MVAAFSLDISVFLSSSYVPEVYSHRWILQEGHQSHLDTRLTDICPIRGGSPFPYAILYSGASLVIYSSLNVLILANRA